MTEVFAIYQLEDRLEVYAIELVWYFTNSLTVVSAVKRLRGKFSLPELLGVGCDIIVDILITCIIFLSD